MIACGPSRFPISQKTELMEFSTASPRSTVPKTFGPLWSA
jgi:hypothetical protein